MYKKPIVPSSFIVPEVLVTDRMRLRPLTIHDAVKDYDAVMESEHRLRTVFRQNGHWPVGMTLEQNIIELGWHQTEFQSRTSFAYTVVSLDEQQVLGCMYIYPIAIPEHDVEITLWVRQSQVSQGLDEHLFETVQHWITNSWPFKQPAYPGRTVSFDDWKKLTMQHE